jgi:membrane associated rhomboid family serine protease
MINLPGPVIFLIATLLAIHAGQVLILDLATQVDLTIWFAFIPLRLSFPAGIPGGSLPLVWTPFTHALLHANWPHVLINSAWLAIFGTPVARRYGTMRFFLVFALCSAIGAFSFALFHPQSQAILVGASGGISGLTGLAVRFIFQPVIMAIDPESDLPVPVGRKLATIGEVFANPRARGLTLVWLALNALTPILPLLGGMDAEIAWQAHIGGFLGGFFVAPLLEQRRTK